jgi:predicted CoA-binding protein
MSPTIAILGASTNRRKYGNIAVRAYHDLGWTVYPVNHRAKQVEGIPAFRSIADVPAGVERVSVYLPPEALLGELDAIASLAPDEVWLNPGSESDEVLARAAALGLNVVQGCSLLDRGVSPNPYRD